MAGSSAKKLKTANEQFLKMIIFTILCSSGVSFLLGIFFTFYSYFSVFNWIGWIFCIGSMLGCYFLLNRSAKCVYDGEKLVSAGEDLKAGLLTYLFDIICLIAFVQILTCFTNWAWILILVVS